MGSHRAADSGFGPSSSGSSTTPVAGKRRAATTVETTTPSTYVGKRAARPAHAAPSAAEAVLEVLAPPAQPLAPTAPAPSLLEAMADLRPAPAARPSHRAETAPVAEPTAPAETTPLETTTLETTPAITTPAETAALEMAPVEMAVVETTPVETTPVETTPVETTRTLPAVAEPGKRRAARHTGSRGPLFRLLPSAPVLAGVATMAVAIGGALTSGVSSDLISTVSGDSSSRVVQASALSGSAGQAATSLLQGRSPGLSRDGQRDAQGDAASSPLEEEAEVQAKQRASELEDLADQAQAQSDKLALNLWLLPVDSYHITNTFGMARSYYSSGYHTGLDFAAPYGTPIHAVANGVVTSAAYDGAFGNKTVVTLEDGTEIWYCHQSSFAASAGDTITAGELIGYIGETGNAYGAHLHIEVHPGGGDAVDPFAAFVQHGVTP